MRVLLAGATGVIGSRLVPLLVDAGHEVVGMSRSRDKFADVHDSGGTPVACDILDAEAVAGIVADVSPSVVIHQVTDLPDRFEDFPDHVTPLNRVRREGTRNLVAAARAAGVERLIAQSVAWQLPGDLGAAVLDLEEQVLAYPGVVVRYGQFFGPGTYYPTDPPPPRIHIDDAAVRTLALLEHAPGVVTAVESG